MLRKLLLCLTIAAVTGTSMEAWAARRRGPAPDGYMLTQPCFACHGPAGASVAGPMPVIGGQHEAYLLSVMTAFRSGDRPSSIMGRLMKGYSDEQLQAMARYLAGLPYRPPGQTPDPDKVALGKEAYRKACTRCHLDGGRDAAEGDYPKLAGQWLPYLQHTMGEILGGQRKVDERFSAALGKLSREEIDAVLHFFAAQR